MSSTAGVNAGGAGAGQAPWAKEIESLPPSRLFEKYPREARAHRDLIVSRAPMTSAWRNFRQFILDVGPAPEGADWVAAVRDDSCRNYEPGKVKWARAADPKALYWRKSRDGDEGEWSRIPMVAAPGAAGTEVPAADADEPIDKLIEEDRMQDLLPEPEKLAIFVRGFTAWRRQVKPAFRSAARPAFLFLYMAVSILRDARDALVKDGLWGENTARLDARGEHPAWIKYCEQAARAEAALIRLPQLHSYSLRTDLDPLFDRMTKMEKRFRTG